MTRGDSKVVLITGASSGLGEATAAACVQAGHRVAVAARRLDRLQALAQRMDQPQNVLVVRADMRDPGSIRDMVARTYERFGRIDALVANAGVGHGEPFVEVSEAHLMEQFEVNVFGVMRCVQAVLPGMLERRSGHVLTVASVAAEIPSGGLTVYASTKGAVAAFSEALRREVEPRGLHVTTILPGFVQSEMTAANGIPMPPASIIGNLVVRLLRSPRRRAVLPRYYGAGIWLNRFFPRAIDHLSARVIADLERRRKPNG